MPLLARGKVRDNYAVGERHLLMVASDRVSAFDVVMNEPIPGKGALLTRLSLFWFERLAALCPNHLSGIAPETVVSAQEQEQVAGRALVVKRLKPIAIEAVVRGYLAGSGWKEYCDSGTVCGLALPEGLQLASRLPEPIYTPAAKAAVGEHDENISFAQSQAIAGPALAEQIRAYALALYRSASEYAVSKGILIADTKFEFGLDEQDRLVLMDEVLTPDSSRYWPADLYCVGTNPPSFDKQYLRDWLEQTLVDGKPWNKTPPPPRLPDDIIRQTAARYHEAWWRLTA